MDGEPRHFLKMTDLNREDILRLLSLSLQLKDQIKNGKLLEPLKGKHVGLIFHKPSLRTRLSFEVGVRLLGGNSLFITQQEIELGKREPISDVARVMGRYLDLIVIRTFHQEDVEEFSRWSPVSVINALTDWEHPCQVFCDLLTIIERLGKIEGIKIAFLGDGNNVARSWMGAAHLLDLDLWIATYPSTHPGREYYQSLLKNAVGKITITEDPYAAVRNAQVIYTDVWASMGEKEKIEERRNLLKPYQVNEDLLKVSPQALVMHCLPAERGNEITDGVLEGPQSVVWDQAENRLYGQLSLILWALRLV
ncbi:MAG: ornithine carbamoyltransferase [bacterium]